MRTLEEVLQGIEAFKADMEELGVDVKVSAAGQLGETPVGGRISLLAVIKLKLKEGAPR